MKLLFYQLLYHSFIGNFQQIKTPIIYHSNLARIMLNSSGKIFMRHSRIKLGKHFERWLRLSIYLLQYSFKWNIFIFILAYDSIHDVLSSVCNTSITVPCVVVWWNERKYKEGEYVANCQLYRCRAEYVLRIWFWFINIWKYEDVIPKLCKTLKLL